MGEFLKELWAFMKERNKFWLLPIILVLVPLGSLIFLTKALLWHRLSTLYFRPTEFRTLVRHGGSLQLAT